MHQYGLLRLIRSIVPMQKNWNLFYPNWCILKETIFFRSSSLMVSLLSSKEKRFNSDTKSVWLPEKWKLEKDHRSKWWERLKERAAEWVKNRGEWRETKANSNNLIKHSQVFHNSRKRPKNRWATKSSKRYPFRVKSWTQNTN